MESIDNLITVSKHLYDHRVSELRNEVETLRKEIQRLNNEKKVTLDVVEEIMEKGTEDEWILYKIVAKWDTGYSELEFNEEFSSHAQTMYDKLSCSNDWWSYRGNFFIGISDNNNITFITYTTNGQSDTTVKIEPLEFRSFMNKLKTYIKNTE